MTDAAILAVGGLAAYAILAYLAYRYSLRVGWQSPEAGGGPTNPRRRRVGFLMGGVALIVCAGLAPVTIVAWPWRVLAVAQAVLFATAGASDLHRFQLPLPLTIGGVVLALTVHVASGTPFLFLAFGLLWAAAIIVAHALLSKGSMQLGDHFATIWIALAMPINGMLAVLFGDAANVVYTWAYRLRRRKVAAAGAWLIAAAGLVAMPPYFEWFVRAAQTQAPNTVLSAAGAVPAREPLGARYLNIRLSEFAADETAKVALADSRSERIAAAGAAGERVAKLALLANLVDPGSPTSGGLSELARALNGYDVDAVREASLRLADERLRLMTTPDRSEIR